MRTTTKRRARQLALVTLAAPVAAWALEQAAHRAEARDQASPAGRHYHLHRWQGRTLVDYNGQPLGSIEVIYPDRVTNQPEPLQVVVAPIDDRDPIEANSLLPRYVVVAVS